MPSPAMRAAGGRREAVDGRMRAPLVGRAEESRRIAAAIDEVAHGGSCLVGIAGPAGIGTTRLAAEARAAAARHGFTVATGHADRLTRETPYACIVELLRPLAAAAGTLHGLEALGLIVSGLPVRMPAPLGDPRLERTRIADAVGALLARAAERGPLALVVDGVQDLDEAGAGALRFAIPTLADLPVMLVLTSREPAAGRGAAGESADALPAMLSVAADCGWSVIELAPGPFDADDARDLITHVSGRDPGATAAAAIAEYCAGRPKYIEALAAPPLAPRRRAGRAEPHPSGRERPPVPAADAAATSGAAGPPSAVTRHVLELLAGLPDRQRRIVRTLAVAGALEEDALARILDGGDADGRGSAPTLAPLEAAGIVASRDGEVRLAVGVVRDAVLDTLEPAERRAVTAGLARAAAALHPDDARLAGWLLSAGAELPAEVAGPALLAAGIRARRMGEAAEAERLVVAAAARARECGDVDLEYRALAEEAASHRDRSDPAAARHAWDRALDLATAAGDPRRAADCLRELAELDWAVGRLADARGRLRAAERGLRGLEPSETLAEVLHAQAVNAVRVADTPALAVAAEALARLADRLDSPRHRARVHLTASAHAFALTDYIRAEELCRLAVGELDGHTDDPLLVMRAHDQLSVLCAAQGDLAGMRAHAARSLAVARGLRAEPLAGWPRVRLAAAELLAGDPHAALRETSEVIATFARGGATRGAVSAFGTHAWILARLGRLDQARASLREGRAVAHGGFGVDRNVMVMLDIAAAAIALAGIAEPEEAAGATERLVELGVGWLPLIGAALLGELAVRRGDEDTTEEVLSALAAVRSCSTPLRRAVAGWIEGLRLAAAGEARASVRPLEAAACDFDSLGMPYRAARAEAAALPALDPARRAARASAVLAALERVHAPVEARRLRESLREIPGGVAPAEPPAATRTLTARELEIARLVAAGMSSAGIAAELHISTRTVTTHLDHVYRRLGLRSRVALTRYLLDSGLLDAATTSDTRIT